MACFESWPWAFPIRGEASHKALIAPEAPAQNGAHLTQISLGAGKNQKWKVDGVDGVFFRITRFGATNSLTLKFRSGGARNETEC